MDSKFTPVIGRQVRATTARIPKVTAEFELITPCFHGAAKHRRAAPINGPTVKGALRFWWRALAWQHHACAVEAERLHDIAREEALLFGRAAGNSGNRGSPQGQGLGRARVLISVAMTVASEPQAYDEALRHGSAKAGPGANYLAYGLSKRNALAAGSAFAVTLRFMPGLTPNQITTVLDAVELFGLIGGLGSRSRRGLGSVQLTGWTTQQGLPDGAIAARHPPATLRAYASRIRQLTGRHDNGGRNQDGAGEPEALPPYTALSPAARTDVLRPTARLLTEAGIPGSAAATWLDALDALGAALMLYRGHGHRPKGATAAPAAIVVARRGGARAPAPDPRFRPDKTQFDRMRTSAGNLARAALTVPRRAAFGLPHRLYSAFDPDGAKIETTATWQPSADHRGPVGDRRASPLLLHIHRVAGNYCYVLAVLPATFLAPGSNHVRVTVSRSDKKGPEVAQVPAPTSADFYQAVLDFHLHEVAGERLFLPPPEGEADGDQE